MDDYIKRSAFFDKLYEAWGTDIDGGMCNQLMEILNAIPTADVRPVVLCRDCKHGKLPVSGVKVYECSRLLNPMLCGFLVKPDWFCADGKRKDDDDGT